MLNKQTFSDHILEQKNIDFSDGPIVNVLQITHTRSSGLYNYVKLL